MDEEKKRKPRKTESFLIAETNNAIRTNHIERKRDYTQENCRCGLGGDRDETNAANYVRRSIRLEMTRWARWSTGNFAKDLNSTIRTNGIYTAQNLSWRMKRKKSHGILSTNGWINFGQISKPYKNQQKKRELADSWTLLSRLTTE